MKFNQYLTNTENDYLVIFNQYLTNTNQYILETTIIGKIGYVFVKYRFILFCILVRFKQYLTGGLILTDTF